ncbi:hypothetical protein LZ30DRAFT_611260, partial [Colletotrichum cereale]
KVIKDYQQTLRHFEQLRGDIEDLRHWRDKYKQLVKVQERNSFVVMLVDGDGYVFDQSFLSDGADGGSRAAQSLVEAIKSSLEGKGLEGCNILLRIYANLTGLSKTLSRAGLATNDKRSIAPFVAGEFKENADFKLRACLQLYAGDAYCKHIYFAACHDSGYVSELKQYTKTRDKFTLVSIPSIAFHPEFAKLGMNIEGIDGVFRTTPLVEPIPRQPFRVTPPAFIQPAQQSPYQPPRYNGPRGSHVPGWRNNNHRAPARTESANPNGIRMDRAVDDQNTLRGIESTHEALFRDKLPKKEEVPDGCVAVNPRDFRLDPYTPSPSPGAIHKFKAETKTKSPCNKFHLSKSCKAGQDCNYSHDKLDEGNLQVLDFLARQIPCQKRGKCRDVACCSGHICQKINCKSRGGSFFCKIPQTSHIQ